MIRVRQVKIDVINNDIDKVCDLALKKANIIKDNVIDYKINKRSIDARDKNRVYYVYEIDFNLKDDSCVKLTNDISKIENEEYDFKPTKILNNNPVIIGSGPCGLFCAYQLAEAGYKPIIFERGSDIDNRVKDVELFWQNNKFLVILLLMI